MIVEELAWTDPPIGVVELPSGRLAMVWGFGSGLARRDGDPPGRVWAVGDRGPNLKVEVAIERYGLTGVAAHTGTEGAKIMPRLDAGPTLAELQVGGDRVERVRTLPIRDAEGAPLTGLPPPGSAHALYEPAVDLTGDAIAPDPSGIDSEGVVALADGGFIVSDEYGPSLLRLDADAQVIERWVPEGSGAAFAGARYPVRELLPAIAAARRLNRGFEAIAPVPGGRLVVAFQSPLADPDVLASKRADHVRLWLLDVATGQVVGEHLYKLEPADSFRRDEGAEAGDRKVSEITALGGDAFLVLERVSHSTKFFRVELTGDGSPPVAGVEKRSVAGEPLPALAKALILDTDDHPEIGADLEGATLIAPDTLLVVNDNDFGCEGAATRFWRVRFDAPLTAQGRLA